MCNRVHALGVLGELPHGDAHFDWNRHTVLRVRVDEFDKTEPCFENLLESALEEIQRSTQVGILDWRDAKFRLGLRFNFEAELGVDLKAKQSKRGIFTSWRHHSTLLMMMLMTNRWWWRR